MGIEWRYETFSNEKNADIVLYKSKDGSIKLDVQFEKDTVCLSLNQLSDLFGRDKSIVSSHLRNVFKEGALDRAATVAKNATVQTEGKRTVSRDIDNLVQNIGALAGRLQKLTHLAENQFATEMFPTHVGMNRPF